MPWHRGDHYRLVAVEGLCLVGLGVCWLAAAFHSSWPPQIKWIEAAIVAVVIACLANAVWLLGGFRQVRSQRRACIQMLTTAEITEPASHWPGGEIYVSAPRMTMYHRPSCLLVKDKFTEPVTPEGACSLAPCRVCMR